MKAFDISYLSRKITKTFWRFPIVSVLIFITFISSLIVIYKAEENNIWQHLMLTSLLGIPLFVSFNLYLERVETRRWFNIIVNAVGFLFLFLFFISLPNHVIYAKHYIRAFVLFLSFFVSMFYLPFIGFHQQMPFWYYNKHFIKRIIVSFFYSFVFNLGISLAILTINLLFNANIDYKWYAYVASFSYFFIFPWFVLVGLPKKFTFHAQKEYYPKELKSFAMYVLIPLNVIYAIILLVYILKIVITGIWPSGWTVNMIFGYSIIELMIIILLFPVLFDNDNKSALRYVYINFLLSVVFLLVYFLAIYKRITEYGLTENRFFIILFGIWMLFNVLYLFLKKIKDLRVISLSFMLLAFISVSGPWNVFRICKNEQLKRFDKILQKNDLINNGKIDAKEKNVDLKTQSELSSIALYLVETHGSKALTPYFKTNLDSLFETRSNINIIENMSELFSSVGLNFNPYYYEDVNYSYIQFYTNKQLKSIPVDSALYMCVLNLYSYDKTDEHKEIILLNDSMKLGLQLSNKDGFLYLYVNDTKDLALNLITFYNKLESVKPSLQNCPTVMINTKHLNIPISGTKFLYHFIFERIEYSIKDQKIYPVSLSGYLLIKNK